MHLRDSDLGGSPDEFRRVRLTSGEDREEQTSTD